jgi:hypothetical protein
MPARAAPPPRRHTFGFGGVIKALEAAVVFAVKVLVTVPPAPMATLAGLTLQVGRLEAPDGELVSEQATFIVPE